MFASWLLALSMLRPDVIVEQHLFAALSALEINEPMASLSRFSKDCIAYCLIGKGMPAEQWYPLTSGLQSYGIFSSASWSLHAFDYLSVSSGLEMKADQVGLTIPFLRVTLSK